VLHVDTTREFYDYQAKHDPAMRSEQCPARLPVGQLELMQEQAKAAHWLIGAHGWSRVDFLVPRDGIPYMLEINTVPGLSAAGNMATMARAAGLSYLDLLDLILTSATTREPDTQ
jgi:D-alanine-D-alanine ligase